MSNHEQRLREIEANQEELKQSIDHSRALVERAQNLLDKHREEARNDNPGAPVSRS